MPWFRIDDGFNSHPKVLSIPRGATRLRALGLWTSVGTWCAKQLTDGKFGPHMITELGGTRADARWLLEVGLWHPTGEGCGTDTCPAGEDGLMQVHDYLDQNPRRSKVLAERAAKAEAGRAGGKASGRSRREAKTKQSGSRLVEPPTRPVPDPSAAAAAEDAPPPLPPAVEILRAQLEARKLHVRWDLLTAEQLTEIEHLIDTHGDAALVKNAMAQFQPNKPVAFAQAWLAGWRELRKPGDLALITADPCTLPGHTGTTRHCVQCAAERKAAR